MSSGILPPTALEVKANLHQEPPLHPFGRSSLKGGRDKSTQQFPEVDGPAAEVVGVALARGRDRPGNSNQGDVVANGGMTVDEPIAEVGDMELAVLGEVEENAEPGFIAEQLEIL